MNPLIKGAKLRPYGEEHMAPAWVAAFQFFVADPTACERFKSETGYDFEAVLAARHGRVNGLTAELDEQESIIMAAFADWFTERVWGTEVP